MIRPDQRAETGGVNVGESARDITIGYTIEQHEVALERREMQVRADLERAHSAEKALLARELEEVHRRMADLERSFETRWKELAEAHAVLQDLSGGLPDAKLDAALEALGNGDTSKAEALFAQVQAMEAAGIARAAKAAFERGKLAEGEVRWGDAARHYAEAARLAPSYDHLFAARVMAWRSGDYPAALRWGEDLLKAAVTEHGAHSTQHAAALSEHALTLKVTSRYAEAEPLFRQALAVLRTTCGTAHPDCAPLLNNLAELLRDTGRDAEAEPLFRQALAIDEKTFGTEHPAYATDFNNFTKLLRDTGRHVEAEAVYRRAGSNGAGGQE